MLQLQTFRRCYLNLIVVVCTKTRNYFQQRLRPDALQVLTQGLFYRCMCGFVDIAALFIHTHALRIDVTNNSEKTAQKFRLPYYRWCPNTYYPYYLWDSLLSQLTITISKSPKAFVKKQKSGQSNGINIIRLDYTYINRMRRDCLCVWCLLLAVRTTYPGSYEFVPGTVLIWR